MLSDAEWEAWLNAEPKDRDPVALIETEYVEGVGTVAIYGSDKGYVDPFDIDAPNYEAIVKSRVIVTEDARGIDVSDLEIFLEDEPDASRFQGQELRVYYGDRSWPRADFRLQATAYNSFIVRPEPKMYRFSFRQAGEDLLDQRLQVSVPYVLGNATNFMPIFVSNQEYYFHAPASKSIGYIADRAVQITLGNYSSSFDTPTEKQTITLTSAATGPVTMRIEGGADISTLLANISAKLDIPFTVAASVSTYDTFTLGYVMYDTENARDVIESLVSSFGGNVRFNRDLELEIFRFEEPGTPDRTLYDADIKTVLTQTAQDEVFNRIELGFQQIMYVMGNNDISNSANLGIEDVIQKPWRLITTFVSSPDKPRSTFRQNTRLQGNTEALDEASRRLDLKSVPREHWQLVTLAPGFINEIGDTVTVESTHYSFTESGADFLVIGNQKDLTDGISVLTLWK